MFISTSEIGHCDWSSDVCSSDLVAQKLSCIDQKV